MSIISEIIKKEYEKIQDINRQQFANNRLKLYSDYPEIEKIDKEIRDLKNKKTIAALNSEQDLVNELNNKIETKISDREKLLNSLNIDISSIDVKYVCSDCKDTGFIDGKKCHCYIDKERKLLRTYSRLPSNFYEYTFDNLDVKCFDQKLSVTDSMSYLDYMNRVLSDIGDKILNINNNPLFVLLYGTTGTGKTYLSSCIANKLIDKLKSVLYISASEYINSFFNKESEDLNLDNYDLVVLDDLGKETISDFSIVKIYDLINYRLNNNLSLVVSTGFSLNELGDIYGESVLSRLFNEFYIVRLIGEDLRRLKR